MSACLNIVEENVRETSVFVEQEFKFKCEFKCECECEFIAPVANVWWR